MDLWWCRFLKGGRTEAPAEKPLTSRSQVLIRSDGTSTFADSHTTVRHYTYPTPSLEVVPPIFEHALVLLATFTMGRGRITNERSWYRLSIIFELIPGRQNWGQ